MNPSYKMDLLMKRIKDAESKSQETKELWAEWAKWYKLWIGM
jgi:hypothetical protein